MTIPDAKLIRNLGKLSTAQLAAVERAMAGLAWPVSASRHKGLSGEDLLGPPTDVGQLVREKFK